MKLRNYSPKVSLTTEQWQLLENCLSNPLNNDGKDFILFFIESWQLEGRPPKNKTNGQIQKELIAFKETSDDLTKSAYDKLSIEAKNKILSSLKKMFCLNGWFDVNNFYPHQIRYAAIVAIDSLSCSRGRPTNENEIKTLYGYWILKIWYELDETDLAVWRNSQKDKGKEFKNSRLVEFSYQLFKLLGYTRSAERIYQDLNKYLIDYPYPLEPLQPLGLQDS